jgi:hypothetical protein
MPQRLTRRCLALMFVATCALGATGAGADGGVHVILWPHEPASNWNPGPIAKTFWDRFGSIPVLPLINDARHAQEGLGPLRLNRARYNRLTIPEQLFVLANLERVTRGETPIYGLWSVLNGAAETGARLGRDPEPPVGSDSNFASIWDDVPNSRTQDAFFADFAWMYEDGPPPNYFFTAAVCPNSRARDCWGHRTNILETSGFAYVGGSQVLLAGAAGGLSDYHATASMTMDFSWLSQVPKTGITYTWAEAVKFLGLPTNYVTTTTTTTTTSTSTTTTAPD